MPKYACDERQVSGIDNEQAAIGDDHKNSVLGIVPVIRILIDIISSKMQRVVDFHIFFCNCFPIFNNRQVTYVIPDRTFILLFWLIIFDSKVFKFY